MKRNIFTIMTASVALSIGLSACHDDPTVRPSKSDETGEVSLASMSIDMSEAEKVVNNTVGRASGVDLSSFIVTITDKNDESFNRTWTYGEMPEIVTLPVSDGYVVNVESHKIQKAEWERPYYTGSAEFSVAAGEITTVGTVTARFASLKVTIVYDQSLLDILGDDAKVTVSANDEGQLVYERGDVDAARAGYFEVVENSTTMIAKFEGKLDGSMTTYETPFTSVEAGQHHIITYSAKPGPVPPEQSGQIVPDGFSVEATVKVINISSGVVVEEEILSEIDPPYKEDPKEDKDDPDPDNPDDPKGDTEDKAATFEATESPNLDLDGVNIASNSFGNAKVTIGCPKGIKHLNVKIVTDSDNFIMTLDDMNLQEFDLAYPGNAEDSLTSLQLPVKDQVINQTEVLFDITNFVGLLCIYPGNHDFVITVTDNENATASMTLRFKAN